MEAERSTAKIVHFVHWSRSGITDLLRSIESEQSRIRSGIILLDADREFSDYFRNFDPRIELSWSSSKLKAFGKLRQFLKACDASIIHCHSFMPFLISYFLVDSTIFFSFHAKYDYFKDYGFKSLIKRSILRFVLNDRRIKVIAVSESVASELSKLGLESIEIWPNALPDTPHRKLRIESLCTNVKICMICRLDAVKNISAVVRAVALFNRLSGIKKIALDIYGVGSEFQVIDSIIKKEEVEDFVQLKGYTATADRTLLLYDFFVSASLNEAFGLSVLQACRAGLPVITTSEGDVAAQLWRMGACVKIRGFNDRSIADAFFEAVNLDVSQLNAMAKLSRELYLDNYNISTYIERAEKGYSNFD